LLFRSRFGRGFLYGPLDPQETAPRGTEDISECPSDARRVIRPTEAYEFSGREAKAVCHTSVIGYRPKAGPNIVDRVGRREAAIRHGLNIDFDLFE
jgi:hypothetical protein